MLESLVDSLDLSLKGMPEKSQGMGSKGPFLRVKRVTSIDFPCPTASLPQNELAAFQKMFAAGPICLWFC